MSEGKGGRQGGARAAVWLVLACACALLVTGCQGCRTEPIVQRKEKAPDIDELEKKKEKPKEDFEFRAPKVLPDFADEPRSYVKPGHWVTVRNLVRANNFDFQADLYTSATDSLGRPLRVQNTDFQISSSRPAPLPKGQEKSFDTNYFIPILPPTTDETQPKSVWMARELRAARGGRLVKEDVRQGTAAMPAYQYYFVALSNEPDRYAYLRSLPSFAAFAGARYDAEKFIYYRVVIPEIDRVAPLPGHALTWTSIACVLWDDVSAGVLTPAQQQALLDWLHWGGQLILSGPNTLEKLRGTFLEPYLPARSGRTLAVDPADLEEINRFWSLRDRSGMLHLWSSSPERPLLVVELEKQAGAEFVPHCGRLLAERRVGSGRVVATAFSLTDSRWLAWRSLDNLMNGAILRRPARDFRTVDSMPDTFWANYDPAAATDPRFISTLRYFSRDAGHFSSTPGAVWEPEEAPVPATRTSSTAGGATIADPRGGRDYEQAGAPPRVNDAEDWHFRGFPLRGNSGMAAWSDRSGPSDAAREALKDASGITVPQGDFVLRVLAVYLAVLAPLNWLLFRALGRVEWAWVAAPVIAMAGTFAVVRLARLDIGFARSFTEVSIAEMQGTYPRAHVTRYLALYTSLSTSYELEFADDGSLAQPFAASTEPSQKLALRSTVHEVSLRRDKQLKLAGLLVNSNTEGFVHCEQIADLGGGFTLVGESPQEWRVQNGTRHSLQAVGLFRRAAEGELQTAWIGDLRAKTTVPVRFAASREQHLPQWDESQVTTSYQRQVVAFMERYDEDGDGALNRIEVEEVDELRGEMGRLDGNRDQRLDRAEVAGWFRRQRAGEVSLGGLVELAARGLVLLPGEVRLIGWTQEQIPGVVVRPLASQELRRTLFVVHMVPGRLPDPQSDRRLASDVIEVVPESTGTDVKDTRP